MALRPDLPSQKLRVGLLGGSFNPPHSGHRDISLAALKLIGLDLVLWLVTPGNPLKETGDYAPVADRMAAAEALSAHPRIRVSDFEARHTLRYTSETLDALTRRYPAADFVWLMGADNLAGFHRWRDWRGIARKVPIAVFSRPGHTLATLSAPAAQTLAKHRLPLSAARDLPGHDCPAWIYFPSIHNPESSTRLRSLQERSA